MKQKFYPEDDNLAFINASGYLTVLYHIEKTSDNAPQDFGNFILRKYNEYNNLVIWVQGQWDDVESSLRRGDHLYTISERTDEELEVTIFTNED